MTEATNPGITATADSIVAQDVIDGRPGKDGGEVPAVDEPSKGWWPWAAAAGGVAGALLGFLFGFLLGGPAAATETATVPDTAVATVAPPPETATVPANPAANEPVQGAVQFTCNGAQIPYPFNGQLVIGNGAFSLMSPQMSPFTGTVVMTKGTPSVMAGGDSGMLTGMITGNPVLMLSLVTQDTGFPCTGGPFPFDVQLQMPVSGTTPSITHAVPLTDVVGAALNLGMPVVNHGGGTNLPLVIAAIIFAVSGIAGLLLHRKFKEELEEAFGIYDDDDDGWRPPLKIDTSDMPEPPPDDHVKVQADSADHSVEPM